MRPLIQYRIPIEFESRLAERRRDWGVSSLAEVARRLAILGDQGLGPADHEAVVRLSKALGGKGAAPFVEASQFVAHRRSIENGS